MLLPHSLSILPATFDSLPMGRDHSSSSVRWLFLSLPLTHVLSEQRTKLDSRSALIYQQAMLIKLNETYLRRESTTARPGSGSSNRLVLTKEIKVICLNIL